MKPFIIVIREVWSVFLEVRSDNFAKEGRF